MKVLSTNSLNFSCDLGSVPSIPHIKTKCLILSSRPNICAGDFPRSFDSSTLYKGEAELLKSSKEIKCASSSWSILKLSPNVHAQ